MDNLIICDRCGSDACYVNEINEEIKNYQCMGCGFITNSLMKKDSQFLEEQMELLPNLYKELMGEDKEGKVWMPATINIPKQGMVFANGTSAENWNWGAVLSIPVKEDERETKQLGSTILLKGVASTRQTGVNLTYEIN